MTIAALVVQSQRDCPPERIRVDGGLCDRAVGRHRGRRGRAGGHGLGRARRQPAARNAALPKPDTVSPRQQQPTRGRAQPRVALCPSHCVVPLQTRSCVRVCHAHAVLVLVLFLFLKRRQNSFFIAASSESGRSRAARSSRPRRARQPSIATCASTVRAHRNDDAQLEIRVDPCRCVCEYPGSLGHRRASLCALETPAR